MQNKPADDRQVALALAIALDNFVSVARTTLDNAEQCHAGYVVVVDRLETGEPITSDEIELLRASIEATSRNIETQAALIDSVALKVRSL